MGGSIPASGRLGRNPGTSTKNPKVSATDVLLFTNFHRFYRKYQENWYADGTLAQLQNSDTKNAPEIRKEIRGLVGAGVGFEPTTFRL